MGKESYAIIEDYEEQEATSLLGHEPVEEKKGFLGFLNVCWHRESKSIADEHFGEEIEEEISSEKEAQMRDGIHTFSLLVLAIVAIGVALIYLSFVLVPLVLSWFFVYIFQPFINFMVGKKAILPGFRLRLPRWIAVIICAIFVLILLVLLGLAIYFSLIEILNNSDKYLERLNTVYLSLLEWAERNGLKDQIEHFLPEINLGEIVLEFVVDLTHLMPQGVLCLLFTMYMLLDYNEKKEKSVLERQIDGQIRKYIIIKVIISLVIGIIVGIFLWIFSVDMWLLFGLLTFLFNFIPNVGSMVASLLPIPIAVLDPAQTWWSVLLIFLFPVVVHFLIGNFVEPKVMGKSFEMTAVAVLVALAFWGAVWGIVGAFMSVPLTVVLHLWLRTIPHPMARFLADLLAGEFRFTSLGASKIDDPHIKAQKGV